MYAGVYAVGRPVASQKGKWMAAVLACGHGAALSGDHATALYGLLGVPRTAIEVSIPAGRRATTRPGLRVRRRRAFETTRHDGIPVTTVACTLVDLAARSGRKRTERAINQADIHGLIDPEALRAELSGLAPRPGLKQLRSWLDRSTFRLTRSQLERLFLPIADRAGLPLPQTRAVVNGYEVDFWWPDLGLVVEADSLKYHRTPQQQARDRLRDQAHARSDTRWLRFTDEQIAFEPDYVASTLRDVAARIAAGRAAAA